MYIGVRRSLLLNWSVAYIVPCYGTLIKRYGSIDPAFKELTTSHDRPTVTASALILNCVPISSRAHLRPTIRRFRYQNAVANVELRSNQLLGAYRCIRQPLKPKILPQSTFRDLEMRSNQRVSANGQIRTRQKEDRGLERRSNQLSNAFLSRYAMKPQDLVKCDRYWDLEKRANQRWRAKREGNGNLIALDRTMNIARDPWSCPDLRR